MPSQSAPNLKITTKVIKRSHSDHGKGHSISPMESMLGPKEKIMYVTCVQPRMGKDGKKNNKPDYLATIVVDPESPEFCQVVHRLYMPEPGDELYRFGWNTCVNCGDHSRKYLVVPGLFSGNIHIIDATTNPLNPSLFKSVKGSDVKKKFGVSYPHTVHCIPNGDILVHTVGDSTGEAKGSFYLLDGDTFQPTRLWNRENEDVKGHDFWYQPRHNIMISTEFGAPKKFINGFNPDDVGLGFYGRKIHFWNWNERRLFQSIDLGEGSIPTEVRFLHNPDVSDCYVVTALGASILHISKDSNGYWDAKTAISIPHRTIENWRLSSVPALIMDSLISLDDKYLFVTCYLNGDVRQYDITDRSHPQLISQVFVGGNTVTDTVAEVEKHEEHERQHDRLIIKGRPIFGGPHMLQLSRDGSRLYVSTSMMTPWDYQFYPELTENGGVMIMLDVSSSGMKVNQNFLVDFGKEPGGAVRAHEMHYAGDYGDCTSDIWV